MAHKPGEKKPKQQQAMHGVASKHDGDNKSLSAPVKGGARQAAQSSKSATKAKPAPKAKAKAPPKPKLLAKPVWTPVGTALSLTEAEERINIREFALRFSSVLELSRTHLDELDEIRFSRTRNLEDEDDDLVPWVSEACVKSLLLGLLNMLAAKGDREKVGLIVHACTITDPDDLVASEGHRKINTRMWRTPQQDMGCSCNSP
jgi:hypothetical protein